jgi:hypothetical protein
MDLFTSHSPLAMDPTTRNRLLGRGGAGVLVTTLPARALAADDDTCSLAATLGAVTEFFGPSTEGLDHVVEKAFREQGRPNGFILGEERAGQANAGLRYGEGEIALKSGWTGRVYWAGPAIGLDAGTRSSRVFALVYNLAGIYAIYKRFPGGDGSLYYIGGADIHYERLDGVVLEAGGRGSSLRSSVGAGYVH